jgi:hypothetical protein
MFVFLPYLRRMTMIEFNRFYFTLSKEHGCFDGAPRLRKIDLKVYGEFI